MTLTGDGYHARFPFSAKGVPFMVRRIDRALMLNALQEIPYYSDHWRDLPRELLFFDPQGIDWERGTIKGLQLRRGVWRRGEFAFPRTIYNRCFPGPRAVLAKLSEYVGQESIFNLRTQFDKWEVHGLLTATEAADYLPKTYLFAPEELPRLLTEHTAVILKPRRGHGGAGVFKVTLAGPELVVVTSQVFSLPLWGEALYLPLLAQAVPVGVYLVQEYIESLERGGVRFDVRIVLQKNGEGRWEVSGELSRVAPARSLLTNGYRAVVPAREVVSREVLDQLHNLGQLVAEGLERGIPGLGELGVDFLLDSQWRPWILEVNGKPDKGLFWKLGDDKMLKRVYLTPLQYQHHLLHSKTSAPGSFS
jgi:glutathione synthase/RimK-type ligase-like ATP-grasp enzyme